MNAPLHPRGAAPVGRLSDLPALEARTVLYLRLWAEGNEAQAMVWSELCGTLGPDQARPGLRAFEALCDHVARHARRPMMRHGVDCACVGADEACLANFIATAAEGDREDAILIAMMMVRADIALGLVSLAQAAGLAFRRVEMKSGRSIASAVSRREFHEGSPGFLH